MNYVIVGDKYVVCVVYQVKFEYVLEVLVDM